MLAIFHKLETSKKTKIIRECCPLLRRKEEEVGVGGGDIPHSTRYLVSSYIAYSQSSLISVYMRYYLI